MLRQGMSLRHRRVSPQWCGLVQRAVQEANPTKLAQLLRKFCGIPPREQAKRNPSFRAPRGTRGGSSVRAWRRREFVEKDKI